MVNLEKVKEEILIGKQLEDIVKYYQWQEFEKLVSKILQENNFDVHRSFRYKTNRRYEIDVLAVKSDIVLAVDCKQWGRGRYKKSALKNSVKKQVMRTKQLNKVLVGENIKIMPLIVTWYEEDLIEHDNVWVVPIWKLNEFLLSLSDYI